MALSVHQERGDTQGDQGGRERCNLFLAIENQAEAAQRTGVFEELPPLPDIATAPMTDTMDDSCTNPRTASGPVAWIAESRSLQVSPRAAVRVVGTFG